MPADQIFVCSLVLISMALFIWDRIPADIVAVGVLLLLYTVPFNGKAVLGSSNAGQVFGNNGLLTVMFMFVLGAALEKAGIVDVLGDYFERVAGGSFSRIFWLMAVLVIISSAFLNNTTIVVVFLPMLIQMAKRIGTTPSKLLIPLSYLAIAGGMCTLIGTSTNLIVNGIISAKNLPQVAPFGMFDITPLGLALSVVIAVFLWLFAPRLLPNRVSLASLIDNEDGREFITAAIIRNTSPFNGKRWDEVQIPNKKRIRIIEVRRNGNRLEENLKTLVFQPGDRVILRSRLSLVLSINDADGLNLAAKEDMGLAYASVEKAALMEGMVGPSSVFVGHSLKEMNFRSQFGVIILALHRHGVNLRENFENIKLEVGDTLLVEGSETRIRELSNKRDFINLSHAKQERSQARKPKIISLVAIALVVILGSFSFIAFEWVALLAALIVVAGRCIDNDEAYQAIDWKIISMLLGTIALGVAMDKTGAAATVVHATLQLAKGLSPAMLVSFVLLISIIFTELLSNNAVAALLTPIAIQMGLELGVDPRPFLIAVMFGASIGFAIPAGYQTHMLVYGPGGYKFSDFIRIGLPLDVICWIVGSLLIPIIWPIVYR